jgi:hypothetical protein
MALDFLKHRWQRILLVSVTALAALLLLLVLTIDHFLTPKLTDKLKSEVAKGTKGLYHINFSDAKINVLQGNAVLYDITFIPDTGVFNKMKKIGKAPKSLYELRVQRLVIADVHSFKLFFHKELNIGRITLDNPKIQLSKLSDKKESTDKKSQTPYQTISKSLKSIHVGEIDLNGIHLTYKDFTGKKPAVSILKKMNLKATDLLIDSATQNDTARTLLCKDITTELLNFMGKSATGLYTYKVKSIKLSTSTSRLWITGIDVVPLPAPAFFAKSTADRFTLHLDSVHFNHFDYQKYRKWQDLSVARVNTYGGLFEVYSNPNGLLAKTDRLVTFPNWAIRNAIKASVNVDTLDIKHLKVNYKEVNKKPMKTGLIAFTNVNARILNITNKKDLLKKNGICTAAITSYFMGKGKFNLSFTFNLTDPTYNYSYKGHLGPIDMTDANPAVMPLGLVKITSGKVKSLDFAVHSTQKTSTGKVSLLYNNLKFDILRADYTKNSLISLLANTVVVKHDNPDDGNTTPRTANVAFIRPASFPFFKTVWLTVLSGMKACAGVGEAQEQKFKKQMTQGDKKEQEKMLKDAKKKKDQADKDFKEKLKQQAKGKKS